MNAVVFEHVPVTELPPAWRARLAQSNTGLGDVRATVHIEAEEQQSTTAAAEEFVTDDPAFGIWRDRADMADVQTTVRRIRAPRFNSDGSRNELP